MNERHRKALHAAAANVIGIADDTGVSLVDVIAEMERYIVEETKVGDAREQPVPPSRRIYSLVDGRLVECWPLEKS